MDDDDLALTDYTPRSVWIEVVALVFVIFESVAVGVTIVLAIEASKLAR